MLRVSEMSRCLLLRALFACPLAVGEIVQCLLRFLAPFTVGASGRSGSVCLSGPRCL